MATADDGAGNGEVTPSFTSALDVASLQRAAQRASANAPQTPTQTPTQTVGGSDGGVCAARAGEQRDDGDDAQNGSVVADVLLACAGLGPMRDAFDEAYARAVRNAGPGV